MVSFKKIVLAGDSDYLANVVEDTSPQLGGTLDCQENVIDNVGDIQHDDGTASDWILVNQDQDKDILIKTNDGGSTETAIQIHGDNGILSFPKQSCCRVYRSTTDQTVGTGATKVQFNAEEWDIRGEFDSSSNYRFTATEAGYYFITSTLKVENCTGYAAVAIYKNGSAVAWGTTNSLSDLRITVTDLQQLNAGEYIEIYVYSSAGASTSIDALARSSWLSVVKVM